MGKLSFFYDKSSVYKTSISALHSRNFKILEMDETRGIIKATSKKGLLKPQVQIEIKINQVTEQQTTIDINSSISKTWLTPDGYESNAEQRFINSLYRCFEKI